MRAQSVGGAAVVEDAHPADNTKRRSCRGVNFRQTDSELGCLVDREDDVCLLQSLSSVVLWFSNTSPDGYKMCSPLLISRPGCPMHKHGAYESKVNLPVRDAVVGNLILALEGGSPIDSPPPGIKPAAVDSSSIRGNQLETCIKTAAAAARQAR